MPTLGEVLRSQREQRGLSQEDLAASVEPPLSPETISNIERGRTRPYRHTLEVLCQALRLDEGARREVWASWRAAGRAPKRVVATSPTPRVVSIPLQPTPLVGRDQEVQTLGQRISRSQVRLLTLVGPGGVGKTRLAIAVAERLQNASQDGVWFVDLSAVEDASLVVPTIAHTLGLQETGMRSLLEQVEAYLRDRHVLLVLDNCEQVLDAAPNIAGILAACPHVKILATSRESLRLRWEHIYRVPPLSVPDRGTQPRPSVLNQFAAVMLLTERARATDPTFAVTEDNASAISELCVRLDGLPLALELAAARLRVSPPAEILAHVPRSALLTSARDAPKRQRSVRATVAWSHELLSEQERMLFRRLGVFAGVFTLEDAEAVCGSGMANVLDGLVSLADKSLLVPEINSAQAPEFRLLATIRDFAVDQLARSGDAAETERRHAMHYLEIAEQAEPELRGPEHATWLRRLEREHDNLRAALSWSLESASDAEPALRLTGALYRFWWRGGHLVEGAKWLAEALHLANSAPMRDSANAKRARVMAFRGAGVLARQLSQYAAAEAHFTASVALARELDDPSLLADSLYWLASNRVHLGDPDGAQVLAEESLAHWGRAEHPRTHPWAMRTLATLAWRAGDYARATTFQQQFFDHAREAADVLEIARGYGFLGILAYEQEQHERATQLLDASREALSNLGVREELAWVVGHCARAARARGEPLQAKQLFIESLELFQQLGVYWGIAECLVGVAGLEAESGQRRRAAQLFGRAAALREEYGLRLLRRDAQLQAQQLAVVREALGDAQFEVAWEMGRRQALETTLATLLTGAVKEKPRPRVSPAGAASHPS